MPICKSFVYTIELNIVKYVIKDCKGKYICWQTFFTDENKTKLSLEDKENDMKKYSWCGWTDA